MSNADCSLTHDYLKSILRYDPETGLFSWVKKIPHSRSLGIAGGLCSQSYWRIKINKKSYKGHRLAWFYVYGVWPTNQIDHINGIRHDNRLINLREAQSFENAQNRGFASKSASGILGVTFRPTRGIYLARLQVNGKRLTLGRFKSAEEAAQAYKSKKQELSKFFNPSRI